MAGDSDRSEVLRQMAGVVANVAVLTALLVYFGWRRAEVQSRRLGFDESLLGASTRDYLLRSVGPVLVLLVVVGLAGLAWVALDRALTGRLRTAGPTDPVLRWGIRLLLAGVVVLPGLVWVTRGLWTTTAYVVWPLSIVAGVLLFLYALAFRSGLPGHAAIPAGRAVVVRACAALLAAIGLFTAAHNLATVEGVELAAGFVDELPTRPEVVVYSPQQLHIDAPGAVEERLGGEESAYRFRYSGLRLLEHTGGQYFLVSDGWTPDYGVVVALPEDSSIRFEFVRDRRGGP